MSDFDGRCSAFDGPFITNSDALMAAMVRSAGLAVIGMDLHGTILCWNDHATALFGYTTGDMVGRQVGRLMPYDRRRELDNVLARITAGEAAVTQETTRLTASGQEIPLWVTTSPVVDGCGKVIAASMICCETSRTSRARQPLTPGIFATRNILVVEDEALIGLGLAATLENAGFDVIGPAGDVATAMDLLDRQGCALAILDVNLGRGETSAPLAERLLREGIPFLVTSGYAVDQRPPILRDAPSFQKPIGARTIVAAVQEALG